MFIIEEMSQGLDSLFNNFTHMANRLVLDMVVFVQFIGYGHGLNGFVKVLGFTL